MGFRLDRLRRPDPAPLTRVLHHVSGSQGKSLDPTVRSDMEPRLGHDFSGVRVYTDGNAARAAKALGARAFTVGRDVYFGSGRYAPHTHEGRKLLAHELTHVVQQEGSTSGL